MSITEAPAGSEVDLKRTDSGAAAAAAGGDAKAAALFQKAYQKMVSLNRIDEQLQSILGQRRTLQAELKDLQSQINGTFQRVLDDASQTPQRLLQEIADNAAV